MLSPIAFPPRAIRATLFATSLLTLVAGCNPTGTCVETGESKSELGASCIINTNKGACSGYDTPHEFYPESGAAGVLRCKSAGFDSHPGSPASSPTALDMYYKKPAKKP